MDEKIEAAYNRIIEDLNQSDITKFIYKDPYFIQKIYEITRYLLKNKCLPPKELTFQCDKISMYFWINNRTRRKEKVFVDLKFFVNFFKKKSDWDKKADQYYVFVVNNGRKPLLGELSFYDKSDGFGWYNNQIYNLKENSKTTCRSLTEHQKRKFKSIADLLSKLKVHELYYAFFKLKRFPYRKECYFQDGMDMALFIRKIKNGEIILPPKQKLLFDKLSYYDLRINADGIKTEIRYKGIKGNYRTVNSPKVNNTHFSSKINSRTVGFLFYDKTISFYLHYLRQFLKLSQLEMSKILGLSKDNYAHIETNNLDFTDFHKMQILNVLDEIEEKDKTLTEMYIFFNSSFSNKSDTEFLAFKLITLLSLNLENRSEAEKKFYFQNEKVWSRVKHKSIKNKICLYDCLDQLNESEDRILFIVGRLKYFLQLDILNNPTNEEIINKTNIALGRKSIDDSPSIYTISIENAGELLKDLEEYKLLHNLDERQKKWYDKCYYLLSCAVEPGKDLAYETYRYKIQCGLNIREFAALFGINPNLLSSAISKNELTKSMKDRIIKYIYFASSEKDDDDFNRFQKAFLGELLTMKLSK